jgi:hypothetical protein
MLNAGAVAGGCKCRCVEWWCSRRLWGLSSRYVATHPPDKE